MLSLDIECSADLGFPTSDRDPVITIACVGKYHDSKVEDAKIIFQLDTCSKIPGADVRTFQREIDLLMAFDQFLRVYDPDVITGYNIDGFDLPYLINRTLHLRNDIKNSCSPQDISILSTPFPFWGRLRNK